MSYCESKEERTLRCFKNAVFQHLNEFYVKYNFDWIDEYVDDIYNSRLTKEYVDSKYPLVHFNLANSKENTLVISASFNEETKEYNFLFNKTVLCNDIEDKYKKPLKIELKQALVHEDTHRQQSQGDPTKRDHPDLDKVTSKDYLKNPQEIDARARELGHWFEQQKIFDIVTVFEKIEKNQVDPQFYYVIKNYQEIGGSVYNKFLSEVYRYLLNEENWDYKYESYRPRVL